MADLARLVLLLLIAALFANVARGTTRQWLRAKFLGDPAPSRGSTSSTRARMVTS